MTEDRDLRWETVKVEHIVRDKWIDFRKVEYRFPDGKTFSPYYNFSRKSYVVIVASDEDGKFLCVKQFRHGIGEVTTEFPAGGIECCGGKEYITKEDTVTSTEDALSAAKRELEEETGYTSESWTHLMTVPSAATIADNYAFIFRARSCRRTCSPHPDEIEYLSLCRLSAEEIEDLISRGKFQQAVHILAWLLAGRSERRSQ